jgi:hypothetical protein
VYLLRCVPGFILRRVLLLCFRTRGAVKCSVSGEESARGRGALGEGEGSVERYYGGALAVRGGLKRRGGGMRTSAQMREKCAKVSRTTEIS